MFELKNILISVVVITLAGCASGPAPNYWQGKYYMAGDPECARHYGTDEYDRMICADKNGVRTGVLRSPISEMQAQAFYQQQQAATSSSSQSYDSGLSNTVNCTKMGEFLNQEIKTFRGMVCPIGWMKAY